MLCVHSIKWYILMHMTIHMCGSFRSVLLGARPFRISVGTDQYKLKTHDFFFRYQLSKYLSVLMITAGICLCTLASAQKLVRYVIKKIC